MTHYPYPSQTFLMQEILGVEAAGISVARIALNAPADNDLLTDVDRVEHERTTYIKRTSKGAAVGCLARTAARRPLSFAKLTFSAVRSAGADVKLAVWRVLQLAEGAIVWDQCRRDGINHLHAQFGGAPAAVAMYAAEIGRQVYRRDATWSYTIHGFHDFVNEREIRLDLKTESASFVVGISDFTTSQVMRICRPELWSKVHVVRCGIDLDTFDLRTPRPVSAAPVALIVGRLSAEKGHSIALDALRQLRESGIELQLRIVGSGPDDELVRSEAKRLGVSDLVTFLGMQPSSVVRAELLEADVFCLPSFAEGVPVSIMESLALGVPVATTAVGGITELVTDGVAGACVAPGRSDLLADALAKLLTDTDLRDRVIAEGRRRVEVLHNGPANNRQMADLLLAAITR
jgi:colanic acid/amylovoran biosynthesis glycosyltransferase